MHINFIDVIISSCTKIVFPDNVRKEEWQLPLQVAILYPKCLFSNLLLICHSSVTHLLLICYSKLLITGTHLMNDIPLTPFMYRNTQLFQSASWQRISVCSCGTRWLNNWKTCGRWVFEPDFDLVWWDKLTLPTKWILFAYYTTNFSNWMVYNKPALLNCNLFLNFSPKRHYIIIFFSTSNNYNFPPASPAPFPLPCSSTILQDKLFLARFRV